MPRPPHIAETFAAAGGTTHWFEAHGIRLRAAHWPAGARGTVLLLQGRTEFIEKHLETVAELQARDFAVWTFDWRGQGASSRQTPDPLAHHVDGFDDYLADLFAFIDHHVTPGLAGRPLVLMGHSMGGHLAARALAQRPGLCARAILTAPMIGVPPHRTLPGWAVRSLIRLACRIPGQSHRYAPGTARRPNLDRPFDGNPLTSCPVRYGTHVDLLRNAPDMLVGGATWGWLRAAFASIQLLRRPDVVGRIAVPVLVVAAGADQVVDNPAIRRFAAHLRHGTLLVIEGARHDLLREHDRFRTPLWAAVDRFLEPLP